MLASVHRWGLIAKPLAGVRSGAICLPFCRWYNYCQHPLTNFDTMMKRRGEDLVAILNNKLDFTIADLLGWPRWRLPTFRNR